MKILCYRKSIFAKCNDRKKKKPDFANVTKSNDLALLFNFQIIFLKCCLKRSKLQNLLGRF